MSRRDGGSEASGTKNNNGRRPKYHTAAKSSTVEGNDSLRLHFRDTTVRDTQPEFEFDASRTLEPL